MTTVPYGFRIVGATSERRRLVDAADALEGYATCDPRAQMEREAYLSAFTFGEDFKELLQTTESTRGFEGACGGPFVWWDIDREDDLERALQDTRRLAHSMADRFRLGDTDLLLFYSGSKGFHLGLPTGLWAPQPSARFNSVARRFAEGAAESAGVMIDVGVYDKVRAFRAPNSRHPKTGLYKRHLTLEELTGLSLDAILSLAKQPAPFTLPAPTEVNTLVAAGWLEPLKKVEQHAKEQAQRRSVFKGTPKLNRQTLEFIGDGAAEGDRHRLLFSAAANLAEFNCPPALAHALLTEAGRDSGLPPKEVSRQIECGLASVKKEPPNV
jgi:hypothetical protein